MAEVVGAHSLKGALKIKVISDILERFSKGSVLYAVKSKSSLEYTVKSFTPLKDRSGLLSLEGLDDRTSAEKLKGFSLCITRDQAEETRGGLSDDEFYYFDIIGSSAYLNGELFGKVTGIMEGAGDILVIENVAGRKFLLPFVDSMTDVSRLNEGRIDIFPIEGLFDEQVV